MSDRSFEQIWRSVLLYAPDLPLPLAQRFVNIAYARTLRANQWSQLKGYSEWYLPAPYTTGTVSVTNGSTTVTGAATVWTSAMVGRQIMMATQGVPWYDIVAVDTGAQTLTLDRAYSGPDLSGEEYEISQVYISAPTDHDYFTSILDPTREWKLHFDVDQKTIDAWDPKRLKVGDVWVVAAVGPDPLAVAGTPENRFEIWPRAGDTRRLPFRYQKRAPLLSASADRPIWPIKSDVLEEGALARLAMYKGTADAPNPYFDLNLYRFHEENYRRELHRAQMEDQRVDQTWVQYAATEDWPFAPIDGAYLQSHDISPMTRWGYGYWV